MTIQDFARVPAGGIFRKNASLIDRTFCFDRIEEILAALENEGDDFAAQTSAILARRSPTSLKLALRLLRAGGESDSLVECLEREFIAGAAVLRGHDFYEGVRAAIVDKDRNPSWSPSTIDVVTDADIDCYFMAKHECIFPV